MLTQSTFLGIGPNDGDPLYGLIDLTHNFFYLVDYRLGLISRMAQVLAPSIPSAVLAIHECANWQSNMIDNTVCNRWGLDQIDLMVACLHLRERQAIITASQQEIVDSLIFVRRTLLHVDGKDTIEIPIDQPITQAQIMFADDQWVQHSARKEQSRHTAIRTVWQRVKDATMPCLIDADISSPGYVPRAKQSLARMMVTVGWPTSFAAQVYV